MPANDVGKMSLKDARAIFKTIKGQRNEQVIATLISGIGSPHWQVKRESSDLLVEFGPSVFTQLKAVIGDGTSEEAGAAMKVIARIKSTDSLPLFKKLYSSEDNKVRSAAIAAVSFISGNEAEQFLLSAFNDPSWLNRVSASTYFEKKGRDVLKTLQRGFLEGTGDTKYWCLRLLVQICGSEARGFLRKGLASDDSSIRHYVIRSMEDVQDDWVHELLIEALGDCEWTNRKAAATTLQLRGEKAVPGLISCLSATDNPDVVYWVIMALSTIGDDRALQQFESRLYSSSSSEQVIEWIINGLSKFRSQRAFSILLEAAVEFEYECENIKTRLKSCGFIVVATLFEYSFSPNHLLKSISHQVLSSFDSPSLLKVEGILGASSDSDRMAVVGSIARLSDSRLKTMFSETIIDMDHLKRLTDTVSSKSAVSLSTLSLKFSKDQLGKLRENATSGDLSSVSLKDNKIDQSSVARELMELLKNAVDMGASDIHIKSELPPIFRIEGVLSQTDSLPFGVGKIEALMVEIGGNKLLERFASDLETDIGYEVEGVSRFRVNFYSELDGPAIAFRVIPSHILSLADLGYPQAFRDIANKRQGLVLVTGPTGSGKSTTIAAMIDHVNKTREDHIITIEDPVEFRHQNRKSIITYRELGTNTNSFGNALRGALRQDPDVILVGEMRDAETIRLAIVAAETGHLVFSTLHTSCAADSVDRILGEFPADMHNQLAKSFSDALVAVVSQILVPGINDGRIPVQEIMIKTYAVANLIREGKLNQLDQAIISGRDQGMRSRDDHLCQLVREQKITSEVAMAFAIDVKSLTKKLYNR